MPELRSVCVYCASSLGFDRSFGEAADALGRSLAAEGVRLVYGGGAVGLMGRVADAALSAGGEVLGVIPRGLFSREVGHAGLTELVEVASMHERKQRMFEESDAFVALPGGLGTLEELAEVTTWAQLGLHARPIVLVDLDRFWQPLLALLDGAVDRGFLRPANRALLTSVDTVDEVLPAIRTALASEASPAVPKWLDLDET